MEKVREACFEIACCWMWDNKNIQVEEIEANTIELGQMTDKLLKVANDQCELVSEVADIAILVRCIHYLERQTIPPMKGDYRWFGNALQTLLELCCPNAGYEKDTEAYSFFDDLEKGIKESREHTESKE
jgi:hypothetical protein